MLFRIKIDDVISRCILYAQLFDGDIHTDKVLFPVASADQHGFYHWSGVLRRLAPNDEDVHAIGCDISTNQNRDRSDPPRGPNRRYYCGFRSAAVVNIKMEGDLYNVELDNDWGAHVDVRLKIDAQGKSQRGTIRTEALMAIAEAFGEPTPHKCACDEGDLFHPFEAFGVQCLRGERRQTLSG